MSETVWSFETANFLVSLEVSPEGSDPADSFQFEEDIEAVRSGEVEWFAALVRVQDTRTGVELGFDSLGGCAYRSVQEFMAGHRDPDPLNRNSSVMRAVRGQNVVVCHYFPSMVVEACAMARKTLRELQGVEVRR